MDGTDRMDQNVGEVLFRTEEKRIMVFKQKLLKKDETLYYPRCSQLILYPSKPDHPIYQSLENEYLYLFLKLSLYGKEW
nr:unnamed protein product [Callosobruchus analis]